jgi:hypothetical protein
MSARSRHTSIGQAVPVATHDEGSLEGQLAAISRTLKQMTEVNSSNIRAIKESFALNDFHLNVMTRMIRDVAEAVHAGGTGQLVIENDQLDVEEYYERAKRIARELQSNGDEAVSIGIALWASGVDTADAIEQARFEAAPPVSAAPPPVPPPAEEDSDYVVEEFGGNYGQNRNEQDQASTQTGG